MAGIYFGVGGKARTINNLYIGVNGVAHRVTAGYIGINGIARQFYPIYVWDKYRIGYDYSYEIDSSGSRRCTTYVAISAIVRNFGFYWNSPNTNIRQCVFYDAYHYGTNTGGYNGFYTTEDDGYQALGTGITAYNAWTRKCLYNPSQRGDQMYVLTNAYIDENDAVWSFQLWNLVKTEVSRIHVGSVISASSNAYPINGLHSDGYYYIRQS